MEFLLITKNFAPPGELTENISLQIVTKTVAIWYVAILAKGKEIRTQSQRSLEQFRNKVNFSHYESVPSVLHFSRY